MGPTTVEAEAVREVDAAAGARTSTPPADRTWALISATVAVVAADWGSKAMAWRLLPGRVIINADTSGALPILPGLVSQPVGGSLVDAAVLVLLAVSGLWLTRTAVDQPTIWCGCVMVWGGAVANATDRWFRHVWLAPGSKRGVVDWIGVPGMGWANLADFTICVGVLLAVLGLALSRLPRRLFAAVGAGVLVLVPISLQTTTGATDNTVVAARTAAPTFQEQVQQVFWVGPAYNGRRILWRDWHNAAGWNLTVEAVATDGQVLTQWRLPWQSKVEMIVLPEGTDAVYVHGDDGTNVVTLAEKLL